MTQATNVVESRSGRARLPRFAQFLGSQTFTRGRVRGASRSGIAGPTCRTDATPTMPAEATAGPAGTTVVVRYANTLFPRPWTDSRAFVRLGAGVKHSWPEESLARRPSRRSSDRLFSRLHLGPSSGRSTRRVRQPRRPRAESERPPGRPPDRRYDHSYNDGGYRGPNDRGPRPGGAEIGAPVEADTPDADSTPTRATPR